MLTDKCGHAEPTDRNFCQEIPESKDRSRATFGWRSPLTSVFFSGCPTEHVWQSNQRLSWPHKLWENFDSICTSFKIFKILSRCITIIITDLYGAGAVKLLLVTKKTRTRAEEEKSP